MKTNSTTKIEDALELLLYAERYRDSALGVILSPESNIREVINALRVFELAHIRSIVVCQQVQELSEELSILSRRGIQFKQVTHCPETIKSIELREDVIPVVAVNSDSTKIYYEQAFNVFEDIREIKKLFICSTALSAEIKDTPLLNPGNVVSKFCDESLQEIAQLISKQVSRRNQEVVILEPNADVLFNEVFTYLGAGTLITANPPNSARAAQLSDVLAISQLMRPYIHDGSLRNFSEDDIAKRVGEFLVYTVHGAVVGASRLTPFGNQAEIGSICTLPRYRGQGLARDIVLAAINQAKTKGYKRVFALTTSKQMQEFFTSLGMCQVDRESLPKEWQNNYDFSRQSTAMTLEISK